MRGTWLALVGLSATGALAQALYVLPPAAASATVAGARSVVFDAAAAARERARQEPAYVERIFVEGRDPDAPRKPRAVEQRFADALLAPRPSPTAGLRSLDTTPCMSVISSWNNLGNSYAPITGCP